MEDYNKSFTIDADAIKKRKKKRFWVMMIGVGIFGFTLPLLMVGVMEGAYFDDGIWMSLWVGIILLATTLVVQVIMYRDTKVVPSAVAIRDGRLYLDDDCYGVYEVDTIKMTDPEYRVRVVHVNGGCRRVAVLRRMIIQMADGPRKAYYFGSVFEKNEQCKDYTEIYQAVKLCFGEKMVLS